MLFLKCVVLFSVLDITFASRRIFGGLKAKNGDYPHQVAVGYRQKWSNDMDIVCGGSLIHPKFVISASHCLEKDREMVVMVGSTELDIKKGMWYDIEYTLVTNDWHNGSFNWDITLLVTKNTIELYPGVVEIVKLPNPLEPDPPLNSAVWVSGWGLINPKMGAHYLKKIQLNVVSEEECSKSWEPEESPRICCLSYEKGWGTCGGDSGGGMIYKGVIVGVLSYGTTDCSLNKPEVYSNVRTYVAWIKAMIKKYSTRRAFTDRNSAEENLLYF